MRAVLALISLNLVLGACSEGQRLEVTIPRDLSPDAQRLVGSAWPKILAACPGLNRYSTDLTFDGIAEYPLADPPLVNVRFRVSDDPASIPWDYRAFGHTCYFSITRGGKELTIGKSACASVCADRPIRYSGKAYTVAL